VPLSLSLVLFADGCRNQTEGERCTSGADCNTDLACVQVDPMYGVCCATGSTLPICNGTITTDAGTPQPEASTEAGDETTGDEASSEGGGSTDDASVDAAADAGAE